ncbi:hypothetical protein [Enterococcus sp.]|uniref:hypothetical protein n=1 Tax=Enterococcus sp. TaxID=35783 RepID=UPI003C72510B
MSRVSDRKNGLAKLKEIDKNKNDYLVIHYSCESFYGLKGKSPKITSIAIENLEYGQAHLFAIYKTAEKMKIEFEQIPERYPDIEKSMLDDFFAYVSKNESKIWLHWNMRDSIFGFKALEHRHEVLGGDPEKIQDSKQINIAALLKDVYGPEYIADPKMQTLMEKNNLTPKHFLNGKDESEAFTNAEYYELSLSTSGKVRMFSQMVNLAVDNNLKVDTPKKQLYGTSFQGYWQRFTESRLFKPVSYIASTIVGAIIGHFVTQGL